MIFKGFKFGMLLQIAIGPICIFVFNEAVEKGLVNGLFGVLAVVIVDGIYIALSIVGISAIVKRHEKILKYFGAFVLIVFGIVTIISAINHQEVVIGVDQEVNYLKTFLTAFFLTGSNPLTIIFWSGVFSTKILNGKFKQSDAIFFGVGAVLATLFFLSMIASVGQFTMNFLNAQTISALNVLVGLLLLYFGVKLVLKKQVI